MSDFVSISIDELVIRRCRQRNMAVGTVVNRVLKTFGSMLDAGFYQPKTHPWLWQKKPRGKNGTRTATTKLRIPTPLHQAIKGRGIVLSSAIRYALQEYSTLYSPKWGEQ